MFKSNQKKSKDQSETDPGLVADTNADGMAQPASEEPIEQSVKISRQEYETLKSQELQARQATDRALRIQAEFENARRRLERDKSEFLKFANHELISELIPFVDDFQRAFAAADSSKDFEVLHKGVEMILKHMVELLTRKGVTPIEAVGKPFDPSCQEALMQEESADHPEHTVLAEFQKGYKLNDGVLRTAKVKVSRRPAEKTVSGDEPAAAAPEAPEPDV